MYIAVEFFGIQSVEKIREQELNGLPPILPCAAPDRNDERSWAPTSRETPNFRC